MPIDPPNADAGAEEGAESFRVNVPASAAPKLEGAPDSGYVLVKFTKDGDAYCLDLQSLMLPAEQPAEENAEDEMPLEDLARKTMKEEGLGEDGKPVAKQ